MARAKKSGVEKVTLKANGKSVTITAGTFSKMSKALDGRAGAASDDSEMAASIASVIPPPSGILGDLGPGLWVPTKFRPHMVAAKKAAKEKLADKHGVSFRRVGDDCLVEAGNGVSSVSILIEGEAEQAPAVRTVIPARAMKLIAAAAAEEIDLAEVWFRGTRVIVRVGEEYHQFRVIQPDLPFPGENLRAAKTSPNVYDMLVDAGQLSLLQKALGAPTIGVHRAGKGVVVVLPEGEPTSLALGFLATCGEMGG